MKKTLTTLLLIIGLQAFSQTYVTNPFLYDWTRGTKFSGNVLLPSLANGTDTIFLVLNEATGVVDSIGIAELKTMFVSSTPTLQQVSNAGSETTNSLEIGDFHNVTGIYALAVGFQNTSAGNSSINIGTTNNVSANFSGALGTSNTVSDQGSFAQGSGNTASGLRSHAEGVSTIASATGSHAEGTGTQASGNYSHAEGRNTRAYSYAEKVHGVYSTAYTPNSTTAFNNNDRLWAIGNGTVFTPNNALTMLKNGTTTIDATWSYSSKLTGMNFSGLQIPSTDYVNKNIVTSGTTANRPSSPATGQLYFDTTISPARVIIYNGSAWVNIDGTAL